ncbi:MAG: leucine-rich repeat domain-containing protein [Ruminococcus sp.]|nr:leucine-rich repeat domain-containing protein [Ruminococcus sp.]
MVKKIISSALALCMVFGAAAVLPENVFTADTAVVASAASAKSGTCGEHVKWTLDSKGTLTISGTGDTEDTTTEGSSPFDKQYVPGIKKIVVKEGVTSLGRYLIRNTDATSITLPKSLKVIEDGALQMNEKLKSVTIPDGVTSTGAYTFYGCKSLKTVKLPKSVTHVGTNAFYGTKWLANLQKKDPLVVVNGILIDGRTAKGKVTIPSTVKTIGDTAFWYNEDITSVKIPNSVKTIGEEAFSGCTKLKTIKIGKKVNEIGINAFSGTKWIENSLNKNNILVVNDILLSSNRETLKGKVTLPSGIKVINSFALSNCSEITSVTIPDGVKEIKNSAFFSCTKLKTIKIPKSVEKIGSWAFRSTKWFDNKQKKNPLVIANNILIDASAAKGKVVIPEGVTSISEGAFGLPNMYYVEKVTSLTIPSTVKEINRYAVANCPSLKTVKIKNGVKIIDEEAFIDCTSLNNVIIPKSVKEIGKYAFGYEFVGAGSGVWSRYSGYYNDAFLIETVISCTKGSTALKYAKANGMDYVITGKAVKASVKDKVYTGKALKPKVTVKIGSKTLKKGTDYTVSYKNNKKIGVATANIKLKGSYTGRITKTFKIVPAIKTLTSPSAGKIKVTSPKISGYNGFIVIYSTSKKFTDKTTDSEIIKGTSGTVKGLKSGKTYYVKIRVIDYDFEMGGWPYPESEDSAVKKIKVK